MRPIDRITDRALGYLGLLLIGAISWTADQLSAGAVEPGVPAGQVVRRPAPRAGAGRTRVTAVATPRAAA
jgi:hypothetical protein